VKGRYFLVCIYILLFLLFGTIYIWNQRRTLTELEKISRRHVISVAGLMEEMFKTEIPDAKKIRALFYSLTESGDFDYLALLKADTIVYWDSRYEGFLPIKKESTEGLRVIKTPVHRIIEFSRRLKNGYFIVGGYSLEYMDEFEKRARKNFVIVLLVLSISALISIFLVVKLENLILKREIALREEAALRKHFEELSALSSAIAHEIKNPLNTLSLLLGRLKEKGYVEEKYLSIIDDEITRMSRIVDQFRDIARPISLKKEHCRLRDIIEKALSSVKVELDKPSIKVEMDIPEEMVLPCDPDLMNQVFYNLIKNAYEAIEDNGMVHITASKSGKKIIIELRDTGKGMDEETLSKATSFFYTTKPRGLGIGLAVTRRIIEAHGGKLYVESQPGKGTRVIIEMEVQDV